MPGRKRQGSHCSRCLSSSASALAISVGTLFRGNRLCEEKEVHRQLISPGIRGEIIDLTLSFTGGTCASSQMCCGFQKEGVRRRPSRHLMAPHRKRFASLWFQLRCLFCGWFRGFASSLSAREELRAGQRAPPSAAFHWYEALRCFRERRTHTSCDSSAEASLLFPNGFESFDEFAL